jgi:hypothetical protein
VEEEEADSVAGPGHIAAECKVGTTAEDEEARVGVDGSAEADSRSHRPGEGRHIGIRSASCCWGAWDWQVVCRASWCLPLQRDWSMATRDPPEATMKRAAATGASALCLRKRDELRTLVVVAARLWVC